MTDVQQWLNSIGLGPLGHRKRILDAVGTLAARAAPAQSSIPGGEAERRQLTVMFCDLVGSVALGERMDVEDYRDLLARFRNAVVGAGKEEAVKSIGAEGTITRGEGNLIDAVSKVTEEAPIDVVVDTVSGAMLPDLIEILRPKGRYTTCGAMGGPMVEIDMRRIYLKNLELHGATQGTRKDFTVIRDYAVMGKIKPLVAGTFALENLGQAQEEFKKKEFVGKLVITVNHSN